MKIPSLFRTPRYQRFNIEPRYYDPVKEEIEQREAQIKAELKSQEEPGSTYLSTRLSGAFRKSSSKGGSATFMQLIIMALLSFLIFGYIYLGNMALYVFGLVSSLLLYLKLRRII